MNNYELIFILKSDFSEKERLDLVDKVKKVISDLGGKLVKSESLGKKSFSFKIKKYRDGYYEEMKFELEPSKVAKLDRKLKLDENLIRYLLVRDEEKKEGK